MCFLFVISLIPGIIFRYIPFSNEVNVKERRKLIIIHSALLIINFIIYLIFYITIGIDIVVYKLCMVGFSILMEVVNNIVVKDRTFEHLFVFGLVETIILILMSLSVYIQRFIFSYDFYINIIMSNIIFFILFLILYTPIKKLIIKIFYPFSNNYRKYYWEKIWVVSVALFFAGLVSTPLNNYFITITELLGKISIGLAIIVISWGITFDFNQSLEKEKAIEQIQLQKKYYKGLSENIEGVRKARHDLKYHISTITWFVENEDFKGLKDYLGEYNDTYRVEYNVPYTGSSAIDGILYHYMENAKKNGIRFDVNCSFNNLRIHDVDLCTLLGNVLENALTASKNLKGDKFISIYSENDDFKFILIVDNSFDGVVLRKNGKIISKKNSDECGLGILSMESICKKYNGYCSFRENGNIFQSSFILENNINK